MWYNPLGPAPEEKPLDEKRVEWLYAHFQAISQSSDRLLASFGLLALSILAVWLSPNESIEVAFIKVNVDRHLLLGSLLVAAGFVFIAFCGNYDWGELAANKLAEALGCDYEELWFIDTHPTFVDYAKFRRPETARLRRLPGRAVVALLYPIILMATLAVAWIRSYDYVDRRVRTFARKERERRAKRVAG